MNIGVSVQHHAVRTPRAWAVEEVGARSLTYTELHVRANQLASILVEHGVGTGDRVSYLLENRLEVIETLVAIARLGAVACPVNFRLTATELQSIWGNAQPRIILTEERHVELVKAVPAAAEAALVVVGDEYEERLAKSPTTTSPAAADVAGREPALIQYTSGTTGEPKGATFSHDAVICHAAHVAVEYALDASSRVLLSLPHNSVNNLQIIPTLHQGATLVMGDVRSFDGGAWVAMVNRERITHTQVVPTMLYRVLEAVRGKGATLATMTCLGYGSAPIPPERVRELLDTFGPVFVQLYGMIEVAALGTMLRRGEHAWALAEAPQVLASVGQPSYGVELRVVDEAGNPSPAGTEGEIQFKGPYVMSGYWGRHDLTEEAFDGDWLRSGDLGVLRDGWFYVVDRKKDLIIRGGQNLSSKQIEDAVYTDPTIQEAAAVGVHDDEWGERVVVVAVPSERGTPSLESVLRACADAGLEGFKRPAEVIVVDELPRNGLGKIQKRELRRQLEARPRESYLP